MAAYRQCILKHRISFNFSVIFHNFRWYDAHITVDEFGKQPVREIKVKNKNIRKYLQIK